MRDFRDPVFISELEKLGYVKEPHENVFFNEELYIVSIQIQGDKLAIAGNDDFVMVNYDDPSKLIQDLSGFLVHQLIEI